MRIDLSQAWKQIQGLINDTVTMLPNLALGVMVFGLFYVAGSYVAHFVRTLLRSHGRERGVGLLLGRLAHYVVLTIGFLVGMSVVFPSFKARDLIQVLGIGGVAIGFAFKDIFQNFLAGVLILISKPFRIGDQIVVKSYEGIVEDIQTRATIIRTFDNRVIVIPNTVLYTEEVTVITAYAKRRSEYQIGIGMAEDVPRVRELILRELSAIEGVEQEPAPDVLFVGMDDTAANVRVRWWTHKEVDVLRVKDRVLSRVVPALLQAGVELPYPTRTLLLYDRTNEQEKQTPEGGPRLL